MFRTRGFEPTLTRGLAGQSLHTAVSLYATDMLTDLFLRRRRSVVSCARTTRRGRIAPMCSFPTICDLARSRRASPSSVDTACESPIAPTQTISRGAPLARGASARREHPREQGDSQQLGERAPDVEGARRRTHEPQGDECHRDDLRGVREQVREARNRVVTLSYDAEVSGAMWLMSDYLPEVADLDRAIFPAPGQIASWLGESVEIETVPLSRDTPDWMLGSYWAHPERVLDASARAATSGFARMSSEVVARIVHAVRRDLQHGTWEARHGGLRQLEEYDVGLRLIVARKR